ncbi:hypothetical protein V9T40_008772 [Parthenolecanium corni]|uniref:Uncharacterized protein n=1 Tax=Parthenolecanium corni TaxID=536013 RepID=A0AAN9TNQ8_9HEMI
MADERGACIFFETPYVVEPDTPMPPFNGHDPATVSVQFIPSFRNVPPLPYFRPNFNTHPYAVVDLAIPHQQPKIPTSTGLSKNQTQISSRSASQKTAGSAQEHNMQPRYPFIQMIASLLFALSIFLFLVYLSHSSFLLRTTDDWAKRGDRTAAAPIGKPRWNWSSAGRSGAIPCPSSYNEPNDRLLLLLHTTARLQIKTDQPDIYSA